jgi:hypothetical protein
MQSVMFQYLFIRCLTSWLFLVLCGLLVAAAWLSGCLMILFFKPLLFLLHLLPPCGQT